LDLTHTPDGVRDLYGRECASRLIVESFIHSKMKSYGYADIRTPGFEYFDVFSKEVGTTPSRELFKFFDKEGDTLVLRPDFTPPLMRCAAKYYPLGSQIPIRLCYSGSTFQNGANMRGNRCELTQMGAECFNDKTIESDAEILALIIEGLLSAGLSRFCVSVGEVNFFKGLCEAIGLNKDGEYELRELCSSKNIIAAKRFLAEKNVDEADSNALIKAMDPFWGDKSYDGLNELSSQSAIAKNAKSLAAIERLKKIYSLLEKIGFEKYVSFDLSMLTYYRYYSGIIFKAFTNGTGEPVAKGGRYDGLAAHFGSSGHAIGCVFCIDSIMQALNYQNAAPTMEAFNCAVVYHPSMYSQAMKLVRQIRGQGHGAYPQAAEQEPEDFSVYKSDPLLKKVIYINRDGVLKPVDLEN